MLCPLFLKGVIKYMHIRYSVVSDKAKTLRQWMKIGFKPKEGVEGVEAWSNCHFNGSFIYYEPDDVESMPYDEWQDYKQKERLEAKVRALQRKQQEEQELVMYRLRREEMEPIREQNCTACQWLYQGYVVKPSADGYYGGHFQRKDEHFFSPDYYYYNIEDCIKDEKLAEQLLKSVPTEYDGHIWWDNNYKPFEERK